MVTMTHLANVDVITLGSIWNGNGQVSADIYHAMYYDKEMTDSEVANAYLALKGENGAAATPAPATPPANEQPAQPPANNCLLYTSPSPRDVEESRMPSSA